MITIDKINNFIGVEGSKTKTKVVKLKKDNSIIETIENKTILLEDGRELLKG